MRNYVTKSGLILDGEKRLFFGKDDSRLEKLYSDFMIAMQAEQNKGSTGTAGKIFHVQVMLEMCRLTGHYVHETDFKCRPRSMHDFYTVTINGEKIVGEGKSSLFAQWAYSTAGERTAWRNFDRKYRSGKVYLIVPLDGKIWAVNTADLLNALEDYDDKPAESWFRYVPAKGQIQTKSTVKQTADRKAWIENSIKYLGFDWFESVKRGQWVK